MKVIMRTIVKIVPGKMAEYMEVEKRSEEFATRAGMSPWKKYRCLSGDSMHTIVYEMEFDSLAAMEALMEKMFVDPEYLEESAKSEGIIESHINEYYTPIP